ncbi:MAG TPA: hypothetical protein DCP91_02010, partial [Eggerthellaceae bacterium]|nr:hypothetical protein [Eggerthellaceae bacterium]
KGIVKTADEMKSMGFVAALNGEGSAFNWDSDASINGGYPILAWQGGIPAAYAWYVAPEAEDSYVISTADELSEFAQIVNGAVPDVYGIAQDDFAGKTVTLAADIDLSAIEDWAPIGSDYEHAFKGTFDGAGKAITGLTVVGAGANYQGLFGCSDGTIKGFSIAGAITGTTGDYYGGVAGFNFGTIEDVMSSVNITASGVYNMGGIAGFNTSGVWVIADSNRNNVVQPTFEDAVGLVQRCGWEGTMLTAANKVGGIVGENAGTVSQCFSDTGAISAPGSSKGGAGGIVGRNGCNNNADETGFVDSCYSFATVGSAGDRWFGGIVGFQNNTYGVSGKSPVSSTSNCYFAGTIVSGGYSSNWGPIVGNSDGGSIPAIGSNNYSLEGILSGGSAEIQKGIVKTAEQMKADSLVLALNAGLPEGVDAVWNADNSGEGAINGGFPVLAWQGGRKVIDPALPWDGTVDISWYTPDAIEYHISTPAQLAGVAALVNGFLWNGVTVDSDKFIAGDNANLIKQDTWISAWSNSTRYHGQVDFNGKTVILDNDLDMGGVQAEDGTWSGTILAPIGGNWQYGWDEETGTAIVGPSSPTTRTLDAGFAGVFDGNGHYVNNAVITVKTGMDSDNIGLIGSLGIDAYVTWNYYPAETWPAELAVRNVGITGYVYGGRSVGGIVGKTYNTILGNTQSGATMNPIGDGHPVIENCVNRATVRSTDSKGVGGVVGAFWNKPLLYNCYSTGTAGGGRPAGSVVGGTEGPLYNIYSTQDLALTGEAATQVHNGYRIGADVTDEYAKTADFANDLGWAYVADTNNINNGYPILFWEAGLNEADLKKDISAATVSIEAGQELTFTGSAVKPVYTVTLGEGEDAITLTEDTDFTATYENNVNVGTAKLVSIEGISGINGYTGTVEVNAEYSIVQRDIEGATITAIPTQWSDGTAGAAPAPSLTVRLINPSATLKVDQDYTVAFANNIATADNPTVTAIATLTGTGNYKGTASAEFEVRYMDSSLEGSGTAEDPYIISSGAELEYVSQMVNNADAEISEPYAMADYKIGADFTATNIDPIGLSTAKPFKGTIYGDGHTIT